MKKTLSLLLVCCLALSFFAACGNGMPTDATIIDADPGVAYTGDLEPYTVKWYLMGSPQPDTETVLAEINKITQEKINTTVELYFIDWGNYDEKMRIALASGDDIDMCFTANFTNDYLANAANGAYYEIAMEDLERLAPNMMGAIPEVAWEASKVGGKLYGMQIERVMANTPAVLVLREFADKYNFDADAASSLEDFTEFFEQIAQNEPGITPIDINAGSGIYSFSLNMAGLETVAGNNPGGVVIGAENPEVVNLFETDEMREFLQLLRDWYGRGIIRADAATVTDVTAEYATGKIAARLVTSNPDTLANQAQIFNKTVEDLVLVELSEPYLSSSSVLGGLTAIARTSQDPERCIMLYDLLFDREDTRLMNLINFGIEDVHHTKLDDTTVEPIEGGGYYLASGWQFGSLFNSHKESLDQPDWLEAGLEKMERAEASTIIGFNFDPDPVKTELAQCQTVFDEYMPALFTGSVDVDEYLDAFVAKLQKAGSETVIDEMNRQLEEWRATQD